MSNKNTQGLIIHSAHSSGHRGHSRFFFRNFGDGGFGGKQDGGGRGGVLQSGSGNFDRINNSRFEHIGNDVIGAGVVADVGSAVFGDFFFDVVGDDGPFVLAGVGDNLHQRLFYGSQ